jgi:Uri superfamily endonuclease
MGGRHGRVSVRPRRHIDYLRSVVSLREVWYTHDPLRRKRHWVKWIEAWPGGAVPVKGFGTSHCADTTHLLLMPKSPSFRDFVDLLKRHADDHGPVYCEPLQCRDNVTAMGRTGP